MAGGFGSKSNPKNNKGFFKKASNETLKDFEDHSIPTKKEGTLLPGESINFRQETQSINWNTEFLLGSLQKEERTLVQHQDLEIQKAIEDLRQEIKKLVQSSQDLDDQVKNIPEQNIIEYNSYQLNFLTRIKNLIMNFSKNITQASSWLEIFNHKKSKRNSFWNKYKSNGQKYMESGEHSAARSAN